MHSLSLFLGEDSKKRKLSCAEIQSFLCAFGLGMIIRDDEERIFRHLEECRICLTHFADGLQEALANSRKPRRSTLPENAPSEVVPSFEELQAQVGVRLKRVRAIQAQQTL